MYRNLYLKREAGCLRRDMVEHFDFEAVSQEVWTHLHSWYSADHTIIRLVKRDRFNLKRTFLDLYPGKYISVEYY